MIAAYTPGLFRGFLGSGDWLITVHTKKCARTRRNVTPAERARSLIPNQLSQFTNAMRARDDERNEVKS